MASLTYDPDHASRGIARLIDRYRKPRTSALLGSWLDEVQEAEAALWQLLVERLLETAEGDQLDVLGRIVGEPRRGRDDDTYRVWISARNLVSRSSGRTVELLTIARQLVPLPIELTLEEYYPAAFVMRFGAGLELDAGYQVAFMLRQAKAAGVLFQMTWPVDAETFRFAPADDPVLSSPFGFDEGAFAVVADGSFIPEPEVEPEFPPGTLVIDGVPLVIGGVPLVITPPALALAAPAAAPLARLRPLVASPVRIVPRAAPLALPAPLLGEFIELVDAFDDASLEMNAGGDKFRVAEALQTTLAEHEEDLNSAAADIATLEGQVSTLQGQTSALAAHDTTLDGQVSALAAHDTTLDGQVSALQPKVAAMRFEFPLRKTSTMETSYEELGVMRFDATPFSAVQFAAELEVAATGQTATIELWNLTAGTTVATLTSTSKVTEKKTASVTLPASDALYSVRLKRIAGSASQLVSCRNAALEVT